MRTFGHPTDRIKVTAPYALASGAGCQVGFAFGVAIKAYALGDSATLHTTGSCTLAKDGSAPTDCAKAYWDNTAKVATTTSVGNLRIGLFRAAAGVDTTADVLLQFNAANAE